MKPLSYRALVRKATKAGFSLRRNPGGSHEVWWNRITQKSCTIPHHKEIKPGTIKNIIRQMHITEFEFDRL